MELGCQRATPVRLQEAGECWVWAPQVTPGCRQKPRSLHAGTSQHVTDERGHWRSVGTPAPRERAWSGSTERSSFSFGAPAFAAQRLREGRRRWTEEERTDAAEAGGCPERGERNQKRMKGRQRRKKGEDRSLNSPGSKGRRQTSQHQTHRRTWMFQEASRGTSRRGTERSKPKINLQNIQKVGSEEML